MANELTKDVRIQDLKESVTVSRTAEKEELTILEPGKGEKGGGNCSCNHSSK